jgi:hypothetical protein
MLKETLSFLALCVVFLLALIGVSILRLYPDWLDWPVARALNNLTKDHPRTTELAYCAAYPIVEGLISVSLIWYAWFSSPIPESRAKLVIAIPGTAGTKTHLQSAASASYAECFWRH